MDNTEQGKTAPEETPLPDNSNKLNPMETAELLEDDAVSAAATNIAAPPTQKDLEFLFDVPLEVSVEVGRAKILLQDLLQMSENYVVELDKNAGDPLDLYVNSRLIARGEAVKVNDRFGIRLTEVMSQADRIQRLG